MFSKKIRITLAALAATFCMMAGFTGVAGAQESQTLTIHYNGDGFEGKLQGSSQCRTDRTVKVYKKLPGADQKLYKDSTDNQGNWDTGNSGQAHGRFYAAANAGNGCGPVTSTTIHI